MKPLLLASMLLCFAAPVSGQQWTEEEEGLIAQIESCWTAWLESHRNGGGADDFYARCPTADDVSMWWTEWATPQGREQTARDFPYFAEVDLDWLAVNPVAVRVWGDVGMVQYYGYWKAATPAGPVTTEYKRTELFRRIDGQWVFLGGQGNPSSLADADPYR